MKIKIGQIDIDVTLLNSYFIPFYFCLEVLHKFKMVSENLSFYECQELLT